MKKIFYLTLLVVVVALSTSCFHYRSSIMVREDTKKWLQTLQTQPAKINISGFWADARGEGWKKGIIRQKGNSISGSLGPYSVEGTVSGKTVYFVMIYLERVDFVFKMTPIENNLLEGKYFRNNEFEDGVSVLLRSEKPIKKL